MSSILKALKKLEDEKNAKQGQRVDITRDIFGAAQQADSNSRRPFIVGGIVGSIVLGVIAVIFITRQGGRVTPPPEPTETQLNVTPPVPSSTVEPRTTLPLQRQEMPPAASKPTPSPTAMALERSKKLAAKPIVQLSTPTKPVTAKSQLSPAVVADSTQHPTKSRALPLPQTPTISTNHPVISSLPPIVPLVKPNIVTTTPPAIVSNNPPKIMVSGIAYNKDAADRLAVINGTPTGEGKTINGVTIEEIMPDKVRFSYGKNSFEVPVGRSNQ